MSYLNLLDVLFLNKFQSLLFNSQVWTWCINILKDNGAHHWKISFYNHYIQVKLKVAQKKSGNYYLFWIILLQNNARIGQGTALTNEIIHISYLAYYKYHANNQHVGQSYKFHSSCTVREKHNTQEKNSYLA